MGSAITDCRETDNSGIDILGGFGSITLHPQKVPILYPRSGSTKSRSPIRKMRRARFPEKWINPVEEIKIVFRV